jgi:hypothetical protein
MEAEDAKVSLTRPLSLAVPEPVVPDMYEVWNWEGDTSVLPGKWAAVVSAAFGAVEGARSRARGPGRVQGR